MKKFLTDNNIPSHKPNNLNFHGQYLNNFDHYCFFPDLIAGVIKPLSMKLWEGVGEDSLDNNYAFTTAYSENQDKELQRHMDDSEITLNLCLGSDHFEDGIVAFNGVKCRKHSNINVNGEES